MADTVAAGPRVLASLGLPNYRLWFAGGFVAGSGLWVLRLTQDWIALTVLTDGSALVVGVITSLQFLPMLVLSPVTGFVADRVAQRTLLLATQAGMAVLSAGLGILTLLGVVSLAHVMIGAALVGILGAFEAPCRQTYVREVVPAALVPNAVGLDAVSFNVSRMAGPALAGGALAVLGVGWSFLLAAAGFAFSAVCIVGMRRSRLIARAPRRGTSGSVFSGFAYVAGRPDLLLVIAVVGIVGGMSMSYHLMSVLMTRIEFGLGPAGLGLLGSFVAVGALTGSLLSARRATPSLAVVVAGAAGYGLASLAAGLMPDFWWFAATSSVIGFSCMTLLVTASAALQLASRDDMRGRVMAVYLAVFQGMSPLGALFFGWLGDATGPRSTLVAAGGASFAVAGAAALVLSVSGAGRVLLANIRWHREGHSEDRPAGPGAHSCAGGGQPPS